MINLTFHGIGGDYITTSTQAHEQLLAYLAAHRDAYWTDTFLRHHDLREGKPAPPASGITESEKRDQSAVLGECLRKVNGV